jgi:hypothetical protein
MVTTTGGGENGGSADISVAAVATTNSGLDGKVIAGAYERAMHSQGIPEAVVVPPREITNEVVINTNPGTIPGIEFTSTPKDPPAVGNTDDTQKDAIVTAAVPDELHAVDQEVKPVSKAILRLENEKQLELQKKQEAWKKVMDSIPNGFVNAEVDGKRTLVLLEQIQEHQIVGINIDGVMEKLATEEDLASIYDRLLGSSDTDSLKLDMIPSQYTLEQVASVIKKSQATEAEAKKIKEDTEKLSASCDFANSLAESLKPPTPNA